MTDSKRLENIKRSIVECIDKFNIINNPAIDDSVLLYEGAPKTSSKELAVLMMSYKKEVTIEELQKISPQSASIIRGLRRRGFIFKDNGNELNPRYHYSNSEGKRCRQIIGFDSSARQRKKLKKNAKQILEKSVAASVSAIEIYNKPDFKYREETFSVLMINAWELLLKAKILSENNDNLKSIYLYNKDKSPKKNYSGNILTISINKAIKRLNENKMLNEYCQKNIEGLIEIRNNSIHFLNKDNNFSKKIQEYGIATLKNYINIIYEWFNYDLSKYNFYLMPLSFFHIADMESYSLKPYNKQMVNLVKYLNEMATKYPSQKENDYNVTLNIKTEFIKAKSNSAINVKLTDDPAAPKIKVYEEDIFKTKFTISYKELAGKLRKKYSNFKTNKEFHNLKKKLEQDEKLCRIRYLNVKNKKGSKQKFYNSEIIKEFDKYYKKK